MDGKIVFDWTADPQLFPDLTEKGSKPLTAQAIFFWLNSLQTYGMVTPMPTSDTVCQMDWRTAQTGKNESSAIEFVTSEQCTKENSPVRVLAPAIGYINFQENGSWWSFPAAVMAYQV